MFKRMERHLLMSRFRAR